MSSFYRHIGCTDFLTMSKIYVQICKYAVIVCVSNILNCFRVTYIFVSRLYYCSKIVGVSVRHIMILIFKVNVNQLHFAVSCCKYVASLPTSLNPPPFVQVSISYIDQRFVYSISLPLLLAISRTRPRNHSRLDMVAHETAKKCKESILTIDSLDVLPCVVLVLQPAVFKILLCLNCLF